MKQVFFPDSFVNTFIIDFNKRLKKVLKQYNVSDFNKFLIGESPNQLTQKRASFLSPLVDVSLENAAHHFDMNWKFTAENSYDSILNNNKLEHKFSLSTSNSWTGHPYSNKVPQHLLIKMSIDGTKISGLFIGIVDLDLCKFTKWNGESNGKHSFADLKIHNDDIKEVQILSGDLTQKKKWCQVDLT